MQAAHASYEAGLLSPKGDDIMCLVLCKAQDEQGLEKEILYLQEKELPHILFREPDIGNSITAVATLPLTKKQRKLLAHWRLWTHESYLHPNKLELDDGPTIFLAGSIEMGKAEHWQEKLVAALAATDLTIFNPRRKDWSADWVQSAENPQFREQVEWELFAMDTADLVVFYFDPNTKSPITLLELGIMAHRQKLFAWPQAIVCCPEGFYRKGNVDIVCQKFKLKQVQNFELMIEFLKKL